MYNIPGVSDVRDVRADPAAGQVTHSILRLSSALEKLYQLDMMVRPPGVAERLKLQMDTAQAQIAKGGGPFSGTSSNADVAGLSPCSCSLAASLRHRRRCPPADLLPTNDHLKVEALTNSRGKMP